VDLDDGVVPGDNEIVKVVTLKRKKGGPDQVLQPSLQACQLSTANFVTDVLITKAIKLPRFGSDETLFVRDYVDLFFKEEQTWSVVQSVSDASLGVTVSSAADEPRCSQSRIPTMLAFCML